MCSHTCLTSNPSDSFGDDPDVCAAQAYFASLPAYAEKLGAPVSMMHVHVAQAGPPATEPAHASVQPDTVEAYQLSAAFKERYADYLKLHQSCLHASDERLRSMIDNKLVATWSERCTFSSGRLYVPHLFAGENRGQEICYSGTHAS